MSEDWLGLLEHLQKFTDCSTISLHNTIIWYNLPVHNIRSNTNLYSETLKSVGHNMPYHWQNLFEPWTTQLCQAMHNIQELRGERFSACGCTQLSRRLFSSLHAATKHQCNPPFRSGQNVRPWEQKWHEICKAAPFWLLAFQMKQSGPWSSCVSLWHGSLGTEINACWRNRHLSGPLRHCLRAIVWISLRQMGTCKTRGN